MPFVGPLFLYPIKGFDPVRVSGASVLPSGALEFDRRWAFTDSSGRFVNGKNYPDVHTIRARYDLDRREAVLDGRTFSLDRQRAAIEHWCSDRLGDRVVLEENAIAGFPDDTASPGPTVVCSASLEVVSGWFGWTIDETRLRFRANIEIGGTDPFWEDRLYGRTFVLGGVAVSAVNPCARCVVPSRHPRTGESTAGFQKRFADLRASTLPSWAARAGFDHFYRFAVNTRIGPSESGKTVREGAPVS